MSYVNKINDGNGTHLIEPTLYATTTFSNANYSASISNFTPTAGVIIHLKINTDSVAGATLSINSGAAVPIKYQGSAVAAGLLQAGYIYSFVYLEENSTSCWEVINRDPNECRIEILDLTGE